VQFDLPSDASAAKWKRFVTTWLAVFPVLLAISSLTRWLLEDWPPLLQLIPSSLMLTATLQWIILPRIQRWSRFWLLRGADGDLRTN
jgi:antibiotic biosynthesis monooxygenase (ABM) superfamily enzyme